MHLTHTISPDRRTLTIHADAAARVELMEMREEHPAFSSDDAMAEAFEHLLCNSELRWILPEVCGDLTNAPILGIVGEAEPRNTSRDGDGAVWVGHGPDKEGFARPWVEPVLERWGFSPYQLHSPLSDLLEKGFAVFTAP
jgi:hypothetical protein